MQIENLTHPGQDPVDGDKMRYTHANGIVEIKQYWTPVEPEAPVPVVDPCEWLIDHGPLLDRFGTAIKMRFLKSTDPDVVALRQDFYGRKWLDLKNPELLGGFYFMAGVAVPVLGTIAAPITDLTPALVDTVFATPVDPKDNQALRKLYF